MIIVNRTLTIAQPEQAKDLSSEMLKLDNKKRGLIPEVAFNAEEAQHLEGR